MCKLDQNHYMTSYQNKNIKLIWAVLVYNIYLLFFPHSKILYHLMWSAKCINVNVMSIRIYYRKALYLGLQND